MSSRTVFADCIRGQQVFIVTNEIIAPLYLEPLKHSLNNYQLDHFILADGEQHKTFDNYQRILDSMLAAGLRRNATVIALGGGVVGDMAGFAAATYQRGIPFIQVPTTLLAQVDSSVGGKTAVNHPKGKNMLGAFHQPSGVITDINTLKTLPGREFNAGIAEIIKAAVIYDAEFFQWLEGHQARIQASEQSALIDMIERACRIKAQVVSLDEKEQGIRAWLNLGHTFGHAIERCLGYGELLHGEAVAIGMVMAAQYATNLGMLESVQAERLQHLIASYGLPVSLKQYQQRVSSHDLVQAMALDKKNVDADLTLILPKAIGEVTIKYSIKSHDVEQFIGQFLES